MDTLPLGTDSDGFPWIYLLTRCGHMAGMQSQVFTLQPRYTQDLETLAPLLVQNLGEVLQSCRVVSGRVMSGELTMATGLTGKRCQYANHDSKYDTLKS